MAARWSEPSWREIVKPLALGGPRHPRHPGSPVASFWDHELGQTAHLGDLRLPIRQPFGKGVLALAGAPAWLGAREVVFLAVEKHDDIGVLLDIARFSQISQGGALVVARLERAVELRADHDRDTEFLGQSFQL